MQCISLMWCSAFSHIEHLLMCLFTESKEVFMFNSLNEIKAHSQWIDDLNCPGV